MTRYTLAYAVVLGAFALESPRAPAPACLRGHLSVEQEYRESWAVFVGQVLQSREVPEAPPNWLGGTRYIVHVTRTFRGSPPSYLDLFSENSSGRFPMDSGALYLLFAYRDLGRTAIDNCGNSGLLSKTTAILDTVRTLRDRDPE